MKKRSFYLIIFILLIIFSTGKAQQSGFTDNKPVKVEEEKKLILQNDGKVHLYVKRNEDGRVKEFEREYRNFEEAKKDKEFNSQDIDQIETLSADLSYDKKNCVYTAVKIVESVNVGNDQNIDIYEPASKNLQFIDSDQLTHSKTSSPKFKIGLPENMPKGFHRLIENDLEVKLLDYFPNPGNGNLTFQVGLLYQKPLELTLIDEEGEVIYKKLYPKSSENIIDEITLSNFPGGIYLLKFKQKNKALTRKLLIE